LEIFFALAELCSLEKMKPEMMTSVISTYLGTLFKVIREVADINEIRGERSVMIWEIPVP